VTTRQTAERQRAIWRSFTQIGDSSSAVFATACSAREFGQDFAPLPATAAWPGGAVVDLRRGETIIGVEGCVG
jgi:hypothetical protein